jgi:hypothetical protein
MESDEEPLQSDSFAPPLASDFARRVIRQARAQRRRQLRRRLAILCVISAAVGFGASTIVRVRLARPGAQLASSPRLSTEGDLKPTVRLVDTAEHPALKPPILGRRFDDGTAADNNPGVRNSAAPASLTVQDSITGTPSQALEIEAHAHGEEAEVAAAPEALPAAAPVTSPPHPAPELPGTGTVEQPTLQRP